MYIQQKPKQHRNYMYELVYLFLELLGKLVFGNKQSIAGSCK